MRPQEQGPPGLIETNQKTTQCTSNSMKNQNHRDSHENLCPALQLLHARLPPLFVVSSRHVGGLFYGFHNITLCTRLKSQHIT